MLLSVVYDHEPGCCVWPVPFAFAAREDVGAALIDDAGVERKLKLDKDYVVQGSSVITFIPEGFRLSIFLTAPLDLRANAQRVLGGQQAGAMPQAAVMQAVEAPVVATVTQAAAHVDDARIAELESRLAGMEQEQAQALAAARQAESDGQVRAVREAGSECLESLDKAEKEACASLAEKASAIAETVSKQERTALETAELLEDAAARARLAAADAATEMEAVIVRLSREVAELESRAEALTARHEQALRAAASNSAAAIASCQAEAETRIVSACNAVGQSWPSSAHEVMTRDYPAGSVLTLPGLLQYLPGRNSLVIVRNGFLLTPGLDYEEVGQSLSDSVHFLCSLNAGDVCHYWIAPTNPGQEAKDAATKAAASASRAEQAAFHADNSLEEARTLGNRIVNEGAATLENIRSEGTRADSNIRSLRDNTLERLTQEVTRARSDSLAVWTEAQANISKLKQAADQELRKRAEEGSAIVGKAREESLAQAREVSQAVADDRTISQAMRDQIRCLADTAWQAAFQASLDTARPGIAAVQSYAELALHVSGVYFINPLLHGHTPFMGIWPVKDLEEARFDGVFFVGTPYPDAPAPPDIPYPEEPALVPEMLPAAAGEDWLPCGHTHNN